MQLVVNRLIAFNVLGDWQLIQFVQPGNLCLEAVPEQRQGRVAASGDFSAGTRSLGGASGAAPWPVPAVLSGSAGCMSGSVTGPPGRRDGSRADGTASLFCA